MKKILVATDFSDVSLNAAKYAADMALVINADLYLLYVNQIMIPYGEVAVLANAGDMEIAEKEMNEFKKLLLDITGNKLNIETEVRMGIFYDELTSTCEYVKPYTVVIGSQSSSAGDRLLFGRHAINVMKNLPWPVITVPPGVKFASLKKIGLACDFKNVVDTVPVDEIKRLLQDLKSELHVLNTGKKDVYDADIVFQSGLFQEEMNGLIPEYHFISSDNVDDGILDFVQQNHIDLLLVLPKRHSLLDKIIHKSHTKQLVLHSHVPLMALHSVSIKN